MTTIRRLFADPTFRLAGRAVIAALIVVVTQIHNSNGGEIAWQAVAVGAGLAFVEVFTPFNSLVGVFRTIAPARPVPPVVPPVKP